MDVMRLELRLDCARLPVRHATGTGSRALSQGRPAAESLAFPGSPEIVMSTKSQRLAGIYSIPISCAGGGLYPSCSSSGSGIEVSMTAHHRQDSRRDCLSHLCRKVNRDASDASQVVRRPASETLKPPHRGVVPNLCVGTLRSAVAGAVTHPAMKPEVGINADN